MEITAQQRAAVESAGKTIVSASAGSGKTFVMIRKLVAAIESGVDLDSVLAVTFTKKAAAQMKDKLRSAIIERMAEAESGEAKKRLKIQLSKIPTANISTIHAFCSKLLRTYFYAAGIDGTFDIISSDDAAARDLKSRAIDGLFERYYDGDDENFKELLRCYRRKRGDAYLKNLILAAYEKLRITEDYTDVPDGTESVYGEEGFKSVVKELESIAAEKYGGLLSAVRGFEKKFKSGRREYAKLFAEMKESLEYAAGAGIFAPPKPLTASRKPADKTEEEKAEGEIYKAFREELAAKFKAVRGDIADEAAEREYFFKSGRTAKAFAVVLKEFDSEYTAIKRDENKLDYNDLEHLTLKLLKSGGAVKDEINAKFSCVFVDEYQDVNPVQERIVSLIGGENVFLVGDVKQAIYGFRGSKSLFFAEKYNRFEGGGGNALRLSSNFRSADGVIDFVNRLFADVMTERNCGFDYLNGSVMLRGGGYPKGFGSADIHIFGRDEEERTEAAGVYSVKSAARGVKYSREGLAVLKIVEQELSSKHYDLKTGGFADTQPGDICILTRKRNRAAADIVRVLTDAGYSVSGAQEQDIRSLPEVKNMLDILSYIDNVRQDIPLATAMLSPLGGFTRNELAAIRIFSKSAGRISFRECVEKYLVKGGAQLARKIAAFNARIDKLRSLSDVSDAAELIDVILEQTGLEAAYSAGGGEKLKCLRRLAAEGASLSLSAFLTKLKDGYEISAPASASSDSIKIMTMHASKGLEFPVVIISDICASFKGREQSEMPFDERFGFAPKYFDGENMLMRNTLLRRLAGERAAGEELKNELNLFYVACTRAMCRLHVMARELTEYSPLGAADASSYSALFDMSVFNPKQTVPDAQFLKAAKTAMIASPDADVYESVKNAFMREYAWADSVNLPVKSSASAILRLTEEDEPYVRTHRLFGGEGETGTERGTAYHRFLELCDFSVKDECGIRSELDKFAVDGRISPVQRELLDTRSLSEILNMSVFDGLDGARIYREREFLCRLPARDILETDADDGVLVQGAIDMLAETKDGLLIADYKYSHKTDEELIKDYSRQLALYKKAVALITRTDEKNIATVIVNIFSKRRIDIT